MRQDRRPSDQTGKSSACRASFFKEEATPPNSEADTPIIGRSLGSRYTETSIHRNEPKPPAYLFRYPQCQIAETKTNRVRPNFSGAPRQSCLDVSAAFEPSRVRRQPLSYQAILPSAPRNPVWRPSRASAPPVKRYLRIPNKPRNPNRNRKADFSQEDVSCPDRPACGHHDGSAARVSETLLPGARLRIGHRRPFSPNLPSREGIGDSRGPIFQFVAPERPSAPPPPDSPPEPSGPAWSKWPTSGAALRNLRYPRTRFSRPGSRTRISPS